MDEKVELLTARERECLRLVDRHFSSKQIARELGMSKTSVDTYCDRARRKLGVTDRYHAARLLAEHERAGPVLIGSGQDAVRTDGEVRSWSGPASSGGKTHDALERKQDGPPRDEGGGEPGASSPAGDRGVRDKVAHALVAGGVSPELFVGPARAPTDRPGGFAGSGGHGQAPHLGDTEALRLQAAGNGAARNPVPDLGASGRELSPWRTGRTDSLGPAARIALILAIAFGAAMAFGAVLAGLQALSTLV
ncbi:MAG: response regulator transcription factor [Phenylobacterium sp.]|uniref:response regulator transcription factor n=1 Tax=Phenylobacterium sp. TaxID=1871053 RepID=UPI0039194AAB